MDMFRSGKGGPKVAYFRTTPDWPWQELFPLCSPPPPFPAQAEAPESCLTSAGGAGVVKVGDKSSCSSRRFKTVAFLQLSALLGQLLQLSGQAPFG